MWLNSEVRYVHVSMANPLGPSMAVRIKVSNNYVGERITKLLQKHSYNSILAAYPLLSIFSVLEDMNNSVWYLLSVVNFKFKGRAFSPTPAKCA